MFSQNYRMDLKTQEIISDMGATLGRREINSENNLNGNGTRDLYDNGAVQYQLSYQAKWGLVVL